MQLAHHWLISLVVAAPLWSMGSIASAAQGEAADIDDALQSAYALFLERYNGLGEPLAWLYTTVKREAWGIRRRASRRRERSSNCLPSVASRS